MRKLMFILICMCLGSMSQAVIIAFEAEDGRLIYQEGDKWNTVENETALNGEYITGSINTPDSTATSFRGFSFPVTAGTYTLYARVELEEASGWANNDSFYVSDSTFAQAASVSSYVNQLDTRNNVEGTTMASVGFKWCQIDTDYVMAADGTGYLMISPREDGLRIDAFAYATADETITTAILDSAVMLSHFIRGAATDPIPSDKNLSVNSKTTSALLWTAPSDPNLASIDGYDVYFGTDPNIIANPVAFVTTESLPVTLAYETTYYWRVDTHVVWDSNDITGSFNDTVTGREWTFSTLPADIVPQITAGADVVTSMEFLPATLTGTVDDSGEGDIASVAWEVLGTNAPNTAMQMITRTSAFALANLAEIGYTDPNLLQDWIGTDTREVGGDPMVLTLKGLPSGTYSWTSYHHDPDVTNTGMFDATVIDASGSVVTADIQIGDSNSLPIGTFTTSITANGTDDVVLMFDQHPYVGLGYNDAWFVMNGFELTDGSESLNIDFGNVGVAPMPGYQAYEADHEVAATFTEQSFSAFGTTVSILPTWGGGPGVVVTDTTNDPSSASQSATFATAWPGVYVVQLSATDNKPQTGTDTMLVTVGANPCAAAQLSTSWPGFSTYDVNEDCVVNLEDFASIAAEWLDDRNMTAQE